MKLKIFLFSFLLPFLFSCMGQNASNNYKAKTSISISTNQKGEIVSEIAEKATIIFQDSQNNYWFGGSKKGLYKYGQHANEAAGQVLTLFTIQDGLCSNNIIAIQEDKLGNIYLDTTEGICKIETRKEGKIGQVEKFATLKVAEGKSKKNDWKLKSDDLWFRMGWNEKGPYRYDGRLLHKLEFPKNAQEDIFNVLYPDAPFNPYGIYCTYKDNNGHMWFGTAAMGACRFDGQDISWIYEDEMTITPEGGSLGIRSVLEDNKGFYWFTNTRYFYDISLEIIEQNGSKYIKYRKNDGLGFSMENGNLHYPYFMSIAEDNNGNLWMATYDDGVWQNDGEKLIHHPIKDGAKDVLLFSIYKDNEGMLWLGTHNAGVFKLNGKTFEKFKF